MAENKEQVRETKKSAKTIAMEEGNVDFNLKPVRKRRKFVKQRNGNSNYYENVEDKYREERMERAGGKASRSFTDAVAQVSIRQKMKESLSVKPLTVTVEAAYDDPELGTCAICEYVSEQSPNDDPVVIYVPYKDFTELTHRDLVDRHIASQKVFIKKRLGAVTDVIVNGFKRDKAGDIIFIGDRNLAMKYNQTFWFEELIDGRAQGYRYEEGINLQARIASVTNWGLFVEILGLETYIPVHEISYVPTDTSNFSNGDIVWVKLLEINRDEKTQTADITVSIKRTKDNPAKKASKTIKRGMVKRGTVVFKKINVDEKKSFVFVDIGRDVRIHCPLTMSVSVGDRVTVRLDDPREREDGTVQLSGLLEHVG